MSLSVVLRVERWLSKSFWQKFQFWKTSLLGIKPFYLSLISLHPCLLCSSVTPYFFLILCLHTSPPQTSLSFFLCQWGYICVPVHPPLNLNHLPSPLPIWPVIYGLGWPQGVQLLPHSMSANQTQPCWERACLSVRNCCWWPLVGYTHYCPHDLWPLVQWLHLVWPLEPLCCSLAEYHARRWINHTNKWIFLICPHASFGKCTLKCTLW